MILIPVSRSSGAKKARRSRSKTPTIPHNHAVLRVHGEQVSVEDLRSTNGTKVNGVTMQRQTILTLRDQLDVGGLILVLEER